MEQEKLKILKEVLGSYRRSGEEYLFFCPFCKHHKAKFSVNLDKGAKCWVCGWANPNLYKIVRRLGDHEQKYAWRAIDSTVDIGSFSDDLFGEEEVEEVVQSVDLPKEFVSLINPNPPMTSLSARKYLKERGVTKQDIRDWKIGYCFTGEYAGRIVVPSFGISGKANYFVARAYGDAWPKYKNPPVGRDIVFNELYIDWESDLVIVEGVFDAIVAGPNAIPLLGSTLRERSKLFQKIAENGTPIYLALDRDAEKKTLKLVDNLLQYDIDLYKIDFSEYRVEDVGEMTKDQFKEAKENAMKLDLDNLLRYRTALV